MSISKFLHRQVSVARVYGIPVRIDYRWFPIFALSVWLIAANLENGTAMIQPVNAPTAWILGVVTTLALFLSIFGHELSHALMARAEGIGTEEIVLHPFGGMARLSREPDSPGAEFRIAVAGPASSFLFTVLAYGAAIIAGTISQTAAWTFYMIGFWNLALALFNLFPGYPLDGGRVLRAMLWRRSSNIQEATRIAAICGQVIAWTLVVFGTYVALPRPWGWGDLFMGAWTVLVGLFLRGAASSVVKPGRAAQPATVADAMRMSIALEPDMILSHFVDSILPLHRQTSFPVAQGGRLHGILALEDLKALPRERWPRTRARDVMRPVAPQLFVGPLTTMARADELMLRNGVGSLAVIDDSGAIVGFLQRGKLKSRK